MGRWSDGVPSVRVMAAIARWLGDLLHMDQRGDRVSIFVAVLVSGGAITLMLASSARVHRPPSDQRTVFVFRVANREHFGDAEVERDPSTLGEVLRGVDL